MGDHGQKDLNSHIWHPLRNGTKLKKETWAKRTKIDAAPPKRKGQEMSHHQRKSVVQRR